MSGEPAPLTDGTRDSFAPTGGVPIYGLPVDAETRCIHYHGDTDVIAIRFRCCDRFYPCHACHDAVADHIPAVWGATERDAEALLCGACGTPLRIDRYLDVDACPNCGADFNPGCRLHRHLYFA
jgi:uncharacterized CHY-type Zn-finger protein